jgi:citrate lyase beta subunit
MAESILLPGEQPTAPRSFHFIPATLLERIDPACLNTLGADTYVFDLEDSVRPADKERSRAWLSGFIDSDKLPSEVDYYVRLNMPGSEWWEDDFQTFESRVPLMIPRISSVDEIPTETESAIIPLIETLPALDLILAFTALNPEREASQKISAVIFGKEDLSAELGHINTDPNSTNPMPSTDLQANPLMRELFAYVRWGTPHDIDIYDGVTKHLASSNALSLAEECVYARRIGAVGKASIHPSQVAVINEVFDASNAVAVESQPGTKPELAQDLSDIPNLDAKLHNAKRIVEVFESNQRAQITAALEIDGIKIMIGPPAYRLAQTILARA